MKQRSDAPGHESASHQELWLGYDGLLVPLSMISALLVYQPVWDRRIAHDYGRVPSDVQAVVLLHDGRALPSRRGLADLRVRWSAWQGSQTAPENSAERQAELRIDQLDAADESADED